MSETISGIIPIRILVENKSASMGYVDYVDDDSVQKWELSKDREYIIPGYQREIRWKPQNVQTLLDDILNDSKFLGNILLSTANKHEYEIMDGQQRITVIVMILHRLKKYLSIVPLCALSNHTYPYFASELDLDFQVEQIADPTQRATYINADVLNQREKLVELIMPVLKTRMYEFRKALNLQQAELAEMVGVRRETIGKLENGRYNPSLKLAMDIAKVFNKTVAEVFTFEDDED